MQSNEEEDLKSPGIAKTNKPLSIFEPIKVPATAEYLPFKANAREAAISGRLVPIAKTVYPTKSSLIPKLSNTFKAPLVISHAASTKDAMERKSLVNKKFSFVSSISTGTPVFFLYQIKMTTIKDKRRKREET